ncbi:G-rich sequence factor 1 isoform X3 [Narcine bancroftii]|uniref:G-rich sequence factor 1 isoform X3 n=1 Tax=Narcine bancroftii TaxID=1343680 RepID=UPI00383183C9
MSSAPALLPVVSPNRTKATCVHRTPSPWASRAPTAHQRYDVVNMGAYPIAHLTHPMPWKEAPGYSPHPSGSSDSDLKTVLASTALKRDIPHGLGCSIMDITVNGKETCQPFQEDYPPLPDYEPSLLEMEQNVFVVKARGLPWSCSVEDVLGFFSDCGVVNGVEGVHFLCNRAGKPSGEAIIELQSAEDVRKALEKHRKYLGERYIEVFELSNSDVDFLLKRLHSSGKELTDGSVVRLRGLPFSCITEDIIRFFAGLDIVENGVTITRDHRGRNTGDAFVQFASQEMAERALAKDREMIGSRYIEIFRSTKNDLRLYIRPSKKMARCPTAQEIVTDSENCNVANSNGDNGEMMEEDGRDQNVQLSKNDLESNHCIQKSDVHNVHMRGLPFRVNGQDVVKFFQPLKPVRIIVEYGPDGKATGEADVHFATHEDAVAAMSKDKSHMQHRYIELYLNSLCSGITARHTDQGNQEKGPEEVNSH